MREVIERLVDGGARSPSSEDVVDACLEQMGPLAISSKTRKALVEHLAREGDVTLANDESEGISEQRIAEALRLIVSSREYQLA